MMTLFPPHLHALSAAFKRAPRLITTAQTSRAYVQRALKTLLEEGALERVSLFEEGLGLSNLTKKGALMKKASPELEASAYLTRLCGELNLEELRASGCQCLWLELPQEALARPELQASLQGLCARLSEQRALSVLISTSAPLPEPLSEWATSVELSTPRRDEEGLSYLEALLCAQHAPLKASAERERRRVTERLMTRVQGLDAPGLCVAVSEAHEELLSVEAPRDLTAWEEGMMSALLKVKTTRLKRSVGLELQPLEDFSSDALAGMERYKRYLDYMSALFQHSEERARLKIAPPKGVLLVGLPGCGKSLAAKLTASRLNLPLLRLELDAVMGRYLGESEHNLSRALETAEAAAPCVLWIDELDKALGGLTSEGSDGGGTGQRLLGRLLTWMQEQEAGVYLFATANRVGHLPPELLRRGRFDELWKVMLPNESEREAILKQKLSSRAQRWEPPALTEGVKLTEGFTGADIEALVREAQVRAFCAAQDELTLALFKATHADFTPLSKQFEEVIKRESEALERHGFRDVSATGKLPPEVALERRALSSSELSRLCELTKPLRFHFGETEAVGWTLQIEPKGVARVARGWLEVEKELPQHRPVSVAVDERGLRIKPALMIKGERYAHLVSEGGKLLLLSESGLRMRESGRFELGPRYAVGERVSSEVGGVTFFERVIPAPPGGEEFLMMETQVTQALYEVVMGVNPSRFKGPQKPVERVSWEDSVKFANALSRKLGFRPAYSSDDNNACFVEGTNGFRLPLEAEWEFAARGGESFKYAGSDHLREVGWYENNSGDSTHRVAQLKPNAYGLYDMSGNVLEWCSDDYYNPGQHRPGAARHIARGGCCYYDASRCVITFCDDNSPAHRASGLGLRLARSLA